MLNGEKHLHCLGVTLPFGQSDITFWDSLFARKNLPNSNLWIRRTTQPAF